MSNADIPTVASPKIHRLNKLVPLHSLSESINRDRHILHKFALSKIEDRDRILVHLQLQSTR